MKNLIGAFLLLLTGCVAFAPTPKAKIGVLAHTEITWPNSTAALMRSLAYYKAQNVDEIVFLGDPTKDGYANQREVFSAAWTAAFKGVRAPKLTIAETGSHEIGGITFTNEGRYPLVDLLCVYPLNGRKISAGSMRGFEVAAIFEKQPPQAAGAIKSSAQGLLVSVLDSTLSIERLDFSGKTAEAVGAAWTVDSELMIHAEGAKAPEFWDDTTISVFRGYDAKGNVVYTVRWPPVLARHTGERAYSYNVMVGRRVVARVQSTAFYLPESRDSAAVSIVIPESDLKGAEPKFAVVPVSSLGKKGRPVWSN